MTALSLIKICLSFQNEPTDYLMQTDGLLFSARLSKLSIPKTPHLRSE